MGNKRNLLITMVATALLGVLSGCGSTIVRPGRHHFSVNSNTLPVCNSRPPLQETHAAGAEAMPLMTITPEYPATALYNRLGGVVTLGFTISEGGTPCDLVLIYATPGRLFVREAVAALLQSKFKPAMQGNGPTASRATFTYTFHLPKGEKNQLPEKVTIVKTTPAYPIAAWLDNVEGFVTFEFTVDTKGIPEDIVVRDSEPAGVFDKAAARALNASKFKVRRSGSKAVPYNATFTYRFRLPDKQQSSDGAASKTP